MKRTDTIVVGFMYLICIFFAVMTFKLPAKAQIYPFVIISLLFLLTTIYVVQMVIAAKKIGIITEVTEFEGFLPKQFLPILGMTVGYVILMYLIGFYISSIVFMACALVFLKVKPWQIALSTAVIIGLVYGAFSMFLGVHLPIGILFS